MDFIAEVDKKLDLPPAEKAHIMRELKAHYDDLRDEYIEKGMDASQAEKEAARKLGEPEVLASRLQSVHCTATWRTALLSAIPFLGWTVAKLLARTLSQGVQPSHDIRLLIFAAVLTLGVVAIFLMGASILQLVRGRRPVWSATWLAGGLLILGEVVTMAARLSSAHHEYGPWNLFLIVLVIGGVAIWAFWSTPKWKWVMPGLVILQLVYFVGLSAGLMQGLKYVITRGDVIVGTLLISMFLLIPVGLRLFGQHPYGNAPLASLFLFAFYGNAIMLGSPTLIIITLLPIVSGLTVLAYARASTWQRKQAALAIGTFLLGMITGSTYFAVPEMSLGEGITTLFMAVSLRTLILLFVIIVIPFTFVRSMPAEEILEE
jgi:hypothetical protein